MNGPVFTFKDLQPRVTVWERIQQRFWRYADKWAIVAIIICAGPLLGMK